MEIIARPFNGRNYWKKNGYTLLNGASTTHRKTEVAHFHGDDQTPSKKKRWLWRLRKAPAVLARLSPKRVWGRLRDGYINMMLRVAGNVGRMAGGAELTGKKIPRARKGRTVKKRRVEEFEARLVLEIYKALATSRGVSEL